jgi:two-component system, LytTR family, sensor kinase
MISFSRYSTRFLVASLWVCLAAFEIYLVWHSYGLSIKQSVLDVVNHNLLVATACYIIFRLLRTYKPGPQRIIYLIAWSLVLSAATVVIHRLLMTKYLFRFDDVYTIYLGHTYLVRGLVSWLLIALVSSITWTWLYLNDQYASEQRHQDSEKLTKEAELLMLRQQLQPHFLFNSLNSISALAGTNSDKARSMIQHLSEFLRSTLRKDDRKMVTLVEEIQSLELYLEIEKVRFPHRLKTVITIDDHAADLQLPPLVLQPIVENAIKFGLYDTRGEITIQLKALKENDYLHISISNPFDLETYSSRKGTGFGLQSIQRRLFLLFARHDLLSTLQQDNTFITEIKVPQTV